MRRLALVIGGMASLASCVVDRHDEPTAVTEPRACTVDLLLDGSLGGPAMVGPLALDASGATVCLHLDATNATVAAHFVAASQPMRGDSSGLVTVLQDPDRGTLQDGWDVVVDGSPAHTHANLEWNAPTLTLTEAVLWLRSAGAPVTATFELSLVEPAE